MHRAQLKLHLSCVNPASLLPIATKKSTQPSLRFLAKSCRKAIVHELQKDIPGCRKSISRNPPAAAFLYKCNRERRRILRPFSGMQSLSPLSSLWGNDRFSRLDCPIKVRRGREKAVKQTRRRSAVKRKAGSTPWCWESQTILNSG